MIKNTQKISRSGYADLVQDDGKLEGYGIKFKHLLDACNIDFNLDKRAGELKILLGDPTAVFFNADNLQCLNGSYLCYR